MRKRRVPMLVLAASVLAVPLVISGGARAQQASGAPSQSPAGEAGALEASIRAQWRRAADFPSLTDLVINWRHENSFVPAPADLDTLRAQVKADAAHPRAAELAEYERRLRDKTPLVRRFSFRARGPATWRLCQNAEAGTGEVDFVDYVLSDRVAWKLTPSWLVLIDPAKPMPGGHPIPDVGAYFMHDLFVLLDAGLRNAALAGCELESIAPSGAGWTCTIANRAAGLEREFHWRWDPASSRAQVERLIIVSGDQAGSRWEFHDWGARPEGPIWMAGRAEKYSPANELVSVITLERVLREPSTRFEEVIAAPDFDVPDALRGTLSFRSITDYRGETPMEIIQTSNGIQKVPLVEVERIAAAGEQDYRRLGWGLAGLATVALVFVRLCRKRGAGTSSLPFSMETHR